MFCPGVALFWFWCCAFSARALCVSGVQDAGEEGGPADNEKDVNAGAAPVGRAGCGAQIGRPKGFAPGSLRKG